MMTRLAAATQISDSSPARTKTDYHSAAVSSLKEIGSFGGTLIGRKESCACGGACPRCAESHTPSIEPVVVQQREAPGLVLRRRGFDEGPMSPGDKTPVQNDTAERGRPRDIDAGLPPAPRTEVHGRCGPDMTDAITAAIDNTHRAFGTWRDEIKDSACLSLRDIRVGGSSWDTMEINQYQIDSLNQPFMPECAWSPPDPGIACARSIEVFPGCYYSGSANYVIFGHMFRTCHDHYNRAGQPGNAALYSQREAERWTDRWKFVQFADNRRVALEWARAGYNLWRRGSAQPTSDRPRCWANCPAPYTGDVLQVHWGPRYFRDGNGE